MTEPTKSYTPEQMQIVLDSLALRQMVDMCHMSEEGAALVHDLQTKMMVKQISHNIKPTPDDVVEFLMERYKDGPPNPVKTNSGL